MIAIHLFSHGKTVNSYFFIFSFVVLFLDLIEAFDFNQQKCDYKFISLHQRKFIQWVMEEKKSVPTSIYV